MVQHAALQCLEAALSEASSTSVSRVAATPRSDMATNDPPSAPRMSSRISCARPTKAWTLMATFSDRSALPLLDRHEETLGAGTDRSRSRRGTFPNQA